MTARPETYLCSTRPEKGAGAEAGPVPGRAQATELSEAPFARLCPGAELVSALPRQSRDTREVLGYP